MQTCVVDIAETDQYLTSGWLNCVANTKLLFEQIEHKYMPEVCIVYFHTSV